MKTNILRGLAVGFTLLVLGFMAVSPRQVGNAAAADVAGSSTAIQGQSTGGMGVHKGAEFEDPSATPESESGSGGGGGSDSGASNWSNGTDTDIDTDIDTDTDTGGCCS